MCVCLCVFGRGQIQNVKFGVKKSTRELSIGAKARSEGGKERGGGSHDAKGDALRAAPGRSWSFASNL